MLCKCGCGIEVSVGRVYRPGHNSRIDNGMYGRYHFDETKKLISEKKKGQIPWNKGLKINISPPNKLPFPPIFDLCKCGCNEIVYGGKRFISGHNSIINPPNKNKHFSEEWRNKISITRKGKYSGKNHPLYGKHHSEESKKRMSEIKKGKPSLRRGIILSEETKKKISENHADLSGKNNPNFHNWASRKPYCEKWSPKLREEIRIKFNYKCFICNNSQLKNITKNGKIRKLSIHHIYYDKEEGCNGKDFVLIPLCMKCHGKTNYDREYWEKFLINKLEVIHA